MLNVAVDLGSVVVSLGLEVVVVSLVLVLGWICGPGGGMRTVRVWGTGSAGVCIVFFGSVFVFLRDRLGWGGLTPVGSVCGIRGLFWFDGSYVTFYGIFLVCSRSLDCGSLVHVLSMW